MGIPMGGQTYDPDGCPKSHPYTYYQYYLDHWNRQVNSVHIKLTIAMWMQNYCSYYSFQIAHETKAGAGLENYQFAWIKTGRRYWGHQRSVGSEYYGDDDMWFAYWDDWYDGRTWHWTTAFEQDVACGPDDEYVRIVPCVTQPPITNIGGGIYSWNPQDQNNWCGRSGYWRPFGEDEHWGSYAWDPLDESACFLNNKWLESMDGAWVGRYPRPDNCKWVKLTPEKMDVQYQWEQPLHVEWNAAARAVKYSVRFEVMRGNQWYEWKSKSWYGGQSWVSSERWYTDKTSIDIYPMEHELLKRDEIFDGDKIRVVVHPIDAQGAWSLSHTLSNEMSYFEIPSHAPDNCYLIGRRGEKNKIIYHGENAKLYFDGWFDGSWPIAKIELVRVDPTPEVLYAYEPKVISNKVRHEESPMDVYVTAGKPNSDAVFEVRAYNTRGREVWLSGTPGGQPWFRIYVHYYGAVVDIWTGGAWREGIAWVWDGTTWHEGQELHMWKENQWKPQ
jgi:hypothetical protein